MTAILQRIRQVQVSSLDSIFGTVTQPNNFDINNLKLKKKLNYLYANFLTSPKFKDRVIFITDSKNEPLRSWLRHCATSRKDGGSILDSVTAIFY